MGTFLHGSPAASACCCSKDSRTPCMATRPNDEFTVVKRPTISSSLLRRARCRAYALSLPELQETSALGRVVTALHSRSVRLERPPTVSVLLGEVLERLRVHAGGHDLQRLDDPRAGTVEVGVPVGSVDARPPASRQRFAQNGELIER